VFKSFDGGIRMECNIYQPERYRDLEKISNQNSFVVRGAGYSYAAASFAGDSTTVLSSKFNRILDFDAVTGLVEVEAGITLGDLYNFLFLKGYFLPTQPGFGGITIGGCIAADVHGKNQLRDGNFHNQVVQVRIFHPSHGFLTLSRETNPELFDLTCGGYGLTGFIVTCVLQTSRITSTVVAKKAIKFGSLREGIELLEIESQRSDFVNTWHDFSSTCGAKKSGILFSSKFTSLGEDELRNIQRFIPVSNQVIDFKNFPVNLYNKWGLKFLNTAYKLRYTNSFTSDYCSLENALFPIHESKIYFAGFGQSGFHEYQVVLPKQALEGFLQDSADQAKNSGIQLSLVSGKLFGGNQKLLRFMGEGYAIAINFPRNSKSANFAETLDKNTIYYKGRPNLIKDSRLPIEVLEATYSGTDEFRKTLKDFDPKRLINSEFSRRLGL